MAIALIAAALWVGFRGTQLRDHLQATTTLLPTLKSQLLANDTVGAQKTYTSLKNETGKARDAGTDPLWMAASALPWIGPNLSAGTEAATSADDVVNLAVGPLVDIFDKLDWKALTPKNGEVSLQPLKDAAPKIEAAASTVQLSYDRLNQIDTSSLMAQVADPLMKAKAQLSDVKGSLNAAASAAKLIPGMMGNSAPKNYLLLIQNNAELRSTGGIPGALAVLTADHGKIELSGQGSAAELGNFSPPLAVDPAQELIYTSRLGEYMQDVNLTPDFPTAAQTAKAMWEKKNPSQHIDGVISVDPVALAALLKVTGPVDIASSLPPQLAKTGLPNKLDSTNLVPTLLSDVYAKIKEPKLQDVYFAEVAKKVFETVAAGKGSGQGLVEALAQAVTDNRVYLWSANKDEQQIISGFPLGGRIAGKTVPAAGFGVFFNDGTGAKMDYYLKPTVQLVQRCSQGGYGQYTVKVTLTNTAPSDAANTLPRYVTGGGVFGIDPGSFATNIMAYGPSQARVQGAKVDGATVGIGSYLQEERPVGLVRTVLKPGQSQTIEINFSKIVQTSEPSLEVTPTIQPLKEVVLPIAKNPTCG